MMDGKTLARLAAVIFVAVTIIATAIEMNRRDVSQDASVTVPPTTQGRTRLIPSLPGAAGLATPEAAIRPA